MKSEVLVEMHRKINCWTKVVLASYCSLVSLFKNFMHGHSVRPGGVLPVKSSNLADICSVTGCYLQACTGSGIILFKTLANLWLCLYLSSEEQEETELERPTSRASTPAQLQVSSASPNPLPDLSVNKDNNLEVLIGNSDIPNLPRSLQFLHSAHDHLGR